VQGGFRSLAKAGHETPSVSDNDLLFEQGQTPVDERKPFFQSVTIMRMRHRTRGIATV
jgi:hypothetical protein